MLGSGLFGSAPVPTLSKKTRVQLNYREKRRICEVQSLNPQWAQDRISQYASKEFGKSIGRALVSKIMKEGERWNSLPDNKGGRTRNKPARHVVGINDLLGAMGMADNDCEVEAFISPLEEDHVNRHAILHRVRFTRVNSLYITSVVVYV